LSAPRRAPVCLARSVPREAASLGISSRPQFPLEIRQIQIAAKSSNDLGFCRSSNPARPARHARGSSNSYAVLAREKRRALDITALMPGRRLGHISASGAGLLSTAATSDTNSRANRPKLINANNIFQAVLSTRDLNSTRNLIEDCARQSAGTICQPVLHCVTEG
jgi:hypothetical protein